MLDQGIALLLSLPSVRTIEFMREGSTMTLWQTGSLLIPLVVVASALVPAPIDASCIGDDSAGCREAESRMNQRAQEFMKAAQKRVLFVETGKDRTKTTEYDFLFGSPQECRFIGKEGRFRAVDESGKTFIEAGCRCCTQLERDREGEEYVARSRFWAFHGRYILFNEIRNDPSLPAIVENDYWCGVEAQWLGESHYKSIIESCDVPIVPRPEAGK